MVIPSLVTSEGGRRSLVIPVGGENPSVTAPGQHVTFASLWVSNARIQGLLGARCPLIMMKG